MAVTFDIADAERLLIRAFEALGADTATAGGLKNRMLALDPSSTKPTTAAQRSAPSWPACPIGSATWDAPATTADSTSSSPVTRGQTNLTPTERLTHCPPRRDKGSAGRYPDTSCPQDQSYSVLSVCFSRVYPG